MVEYLRKGERRITETTLDTRPAGELEDRERPRAASDLLGHERERARLDSGPGGLRIDISTGAGGQGVSSVLQAILEDPNVREDFKRRIRETRGMIDVFGGRKPERSAD